MEDFSFVVRFTFAVAVKEQFGHTPLSLKEDIPWNCQHLVIGTGLQGRLPVMEQVWTEARNRGVAITICTTPEAIEVLKTDPAETNAILHLTCCSRLIWSSRCCDPPGFVGLVTLPPDDLSLGGPGRIHPRAFRKARQACHASCLGGLMPGALDLSNSRIEISGGSTTTAAALVNLLAWPWQGPPLDISHPCNI